CGIRKVYGAYRTIGEEQGWATLMGKDSNGASDETLTVDDPSLKSLAKLYKDGCSLTLDLGSTRLSDPMRAAIEAKVPKELRGDFLPSSLYVEIGGHDVILPGVDDDGTLLARAFVEIRLFG